MRQYKPLLPERSRTTLTPFRRKNEHHNLHKVLVYYRVVASHRISFGLLCLKNEVVPERAIWFYMQTVQYVLLFKWKSVLY